MLTVEEKNYMTTMNIQAEILDFTHKLNLLDYYSSWNLLYCQRKEPVKPEKVTQV